MLIDSALLSQQDLENSNSVLYLKVISRLYFIHLLLHILLILRLEFDQLSDLKNKGNNPWVI